MDRKPNHDCRGRAYRDALAVRATEAKQMIAEMCSKFRCPRMAIPAGDLLHAKPCGDEDLFISDLIDDLAHAALARGVDGVGLIAAERLRQVDGEGWTPEHDDEHEDGALAVAGACYAMVPGQREEQEPDGCPRIWPWDRSWWKPTPDDRVRELVRAGALIAAEIDRLLRAKGGA